MQKSNRAPIEIPATAGCFGQQEATSAAAILGWWATDSVDSRGSGGSRTVQGRLCRNPCKERHTIQNQQNIRQRLKKKKTRKHTLTQLAASKHVTRQPSASCGSSSTAKSVAARSSTKRTCTRSHRARNRHTTRKRARKRSFFPTT